MTGIVRDRRYLDHDPGSYHPESPRRLEAIYTILDGEDMRDRFVSVESRFATRDEIAMNHSAWYVDLVAGTAGKRHASLDVDTQTSPRSYETALLAAGGFLNAVERVAAGELRNAFALVRPPGHHAEADGAAGFCIFNNIAIGARLALKKLRMERVLIVDWDLHHGNGTQHSFYTEPRVLYFSTHQYPFYPGTGRIAEIGSRDGLGYTINVPLPRGPGDGEYVRIYRQILEPVAHAYRPDLVLLSAGFDIYRKDPLGGMNLSVPGFASLTRILMNIADACCDGRFVITLEGGYNIDGQAQGVKAVLKEMRNDTMVSEDFLARLDNESDRRSIDPIIQKVIEQIKPLWQVF
ncbi:MAG: histone deacetylase [Deltaproteobacteria bacterium]|nr:histone deacetylase [Deltaproteobacteria bacterium]